MRNTCLVHLFFLDLICLLIFGNEYNYESPHCAIFSILLLLHPDSVLIFSLEPCSQTPSVYTIPLVWETKFCTHTKQQAQLWFYREKAGWQRLWTNCSKHSMNLVCSLCLRPFSCGVVPKYLVFPYFCTTYFCFNFRIYTVPNELEYEHEFWISKNKIGRVRVTSRYYRNRACT
jgi:hypothetical protein